MLAQEARQVMEEAHGSVREALQEWAQSRGLAVHDPQAIYRTAYQLSMAGEIDKNLLTAIGHFAQAYDIFKGIKGSPRPDVIASYVSLAREIKEAIDQEAWTSQGAEVKE